MLGLNGEHEGAAAPPQGSGRSGLISVIIPVLDEEQALPACLARLAAQSPPLEVIVVDGGSTDGSRALASASGAMVLAAPRGRAGQMNTGAAVARGEVLLFLHADTRLPEGAADRLRAAIAGGVSAGAFTMVFDQPGWSYRAVEWLADGYARLIGDLYGDRAIFVRRDLFHCLGGYRELPIMEDLDLSVRLRRAGARLQLLEGPVITSARRVLATGWPRLIWASVRLIAAYHLQARLAADAVQLFATGKQGADRAARP